MPLAAGKYKGETMKLKYSPVHSTKDTIIEATGENTLRIDGEDYEFDLASVTWPEIRKQTEDAILEAHRENGELFVVVRRYYSGSCNAWDTAEYWEVNP
jgi:hypothetical protein